MQLPDLNLLPPLEALLRTASVTAAAEELSISPSAMSRTLGRLRRVVGDPLLVPAGRGLVLTDVARTMHPEVLAALDGALAALAPAERVDIATVRRRVVIRTNDALAAVLCVPLIARIRAAAPGLSLRIVPEGDEDPLDLRAQVDLDIGAPPPLPPDTHAEELYRHGYVAVFAAGTVNGRLTVRRFADTPHVTVSRRGVVHSVVDDRLVELGLVRRVLITVPTPDVACGVAADGGVLALVPEPAAHLLARRHGLVSAPIPLELPTVPIAMMWHRRNDVDPVQRWLRETVRSVATSALAAP